MTPAQTRYIAAAGENPIAGEVGATSDVDLRLANLRATGTTLVVNADNNPAARDTGFLTRTATEMWTGLMRDDTDGTWKLGQTTTLGDTFNFTANGSLALSTLIATSNLSSSGNVAAPTLNARDSASNDNGRDQGVEITGVTTDSDNASGRVFFRESGASDTAAERYGVSLAYEATASDTLGLGLGANQFGIVCHDNSLSGDVALTVDRTSNQVTIPQIGSASEPALHIGVSSPGCGIYQNGTSQLALAGGGDQVAEFGTAATFMKAVRAISGAASAPGLSFSADTQLGLYRAAADTLGVCADGSERLRVGTAAVTCYTMKNSLCRLFGH